MEKRYSRILEIVGKEKETSMLDLAAFFSVSYDSIRRDLIVLEREGLITRKKGMVYPTKGKVLAYKLLSSTQAKDNIAKKAASLIKDGQLVFIDAGSTTLNMYKYITAKDITVVTASVSLGLNLNRNGIKTFLLPGSYNSKHDSISGTMASKYIGRFFFDVAFVCTTAVDTKIGFTCNSEAASELKKEALKLSRKQYVLCDSSKYGKHCICKIADLYHSTIITDINDNYFPIDVKIIEVEKEI